jgi:hypothetical protein
MKRQLVFIHGRAQEQKDSAALKIEWIDAFKEGLAKSGLTLPIPEPDIRFPFFGDTLYDLVDGKTAGEAAQVIVRGDNTDEEEKRFTRAVIQAIRAKAGITDEQMAGLSGLDVIDRGHSIGNGSKRCSGRSTATCRTAAAQALRCLRTTSTST